jgi:hypothetical protein
VLAQRVGCGGHGAFAIARRRASRQRAFACPTVRSPARTQYQRSVMANTFSGRNTLVLCGAEGIDGTRTGALRSTQLRFKPCAERSGGKPQSRSPIAPIRFASKPRGNFAMAWIIAMPQMEGVSRFSLVFLDACRDDPFRTKISAGTREAPTRGLAPTTPPPP